jgi:hypothetical protein
MKAQSTTRYGYSVLLALPTYVTETGLVEPYFVHVWGRSTKDAVYIARLQAKKAVPSIEKISDLQVLLILRGHIHAV